MVSKATFAQMAMVVALLPLTLSPTRAATINYSTDAYPGDPIAKPSESQEWSAFQAALVADPRIRITDVTETSSGVPDLNPDVPLLYPLVPNASSSQSGVSVVFKPKSLVEVDTTSPSSSPFSITSKKSDLAMVFSAQKNTGSFDPGIAGYAINQINFQMTGDLALAAPFYALGSGAYGEIRTIFSLTLSKVDYESLATPITKSYSLPLYVTRQGLGTITTATSTFNDTAFATSSGADSRNYAWDTRLVSFTDLHKMFDLNSQVAITEVSLSLTSEVLAAGYYGQGSSNVSQINVGSGIEAIAAQPVPEPPTIILAGLGAVAVVANGYRRKKQRRDTEAEMLLDAMEETGAIALTA